MLAALHGAAAVVRNRTANRQDILTEKLMMLVILVPLRLLSRLEDKGKGDPELHFGFRILTLPTIYFLIWLFKALPSRDESMQ